jgi:hypothetical protein
MRRILANVIGPDKLRAEGQINTLHVRDFTAFAA